ncbi:MAG: hypothetical protein Ct9H90mP9_0980 [Pseudomonadota bacterium]|nr:MAG: hypothetical protein Ct9H90mP9_0980 [Pseudomonadota bacterium]
MLRWFSGPFPRGTNPGEGSGEFPCGINLASHPLGKVRNALDYLHMPTG